MNIQMTDLNTTPYQQEYSDAAEASSHYCCQERDGDVHLQGAPVWTGPPPQPSLPGIAPHPQQHIVLTDMLNPLSYRFHCPCQSAQCQVTYPDYLLEPQPSQYQLLTGPAPGPADNSHPSSVCASWFADDPILCSMMPGDSHTCVTVDHQQLQEGPTGVTSHVTQPVVCSVGGGGAVVLVNHCEAGPSFVPVETAHREDGVTPDVSVSSGTPSQFTQYHETACPLYESRGQNLQPQAPPTRTVGSLCESKSRKPCHCTRSQCLKLYCECFANGSMCSNCDCLNCNNNAEHEVNRHKAIKSCLRRNPDAFRPKIGGGKSGKVKGWHNKGCNCKRSGCLKNYCECYEANIMCTSSCKCVGCRNYDDGSQTGLRQKSEEVKDGRPVSVITPAVVEAVCGCLLSQAEEAELEAQSPAQAESKVLEEFGHCLSQIIKAMSKSSTH